MQAHAETQATHEALPAYSGLPEETLPSFEESVPSGALVSPLPPAQHSAQCLFPRVFCVYENILSRTRLIGEHKSTATLSLRHHNRIFHEYDQVLHLGRTDAFPVIAGLKNKFLKTGFSVSLPGAGQSIPGPLTVTEAVQSASTGFRTKKFEFTVEVGRVRETFQWRPRDFKLYMRGSNRHWILLRRALDRPPDGAPPDWAPDYDEGAVEGMEIVACWDTQAVRTTKLTTFKFMGTGASGLLGQRWEIMAVMSGVHICITEMETSAATGNAGIVAGAMAAS